MTPAAPWSIKLIEGEPVQVGRRQLIPVVRVRSSVRRQVTFGTDGSRGSGGGFVWLKPVAVIERWPDGSERRIPIPDATMAAVQGMVIGALIMPLLYLSILLLRFLWRRRPHASRAG